MAVYNADPRVSNAYGSVQMHAERACLCFAQQLTVMGLLMLCSMMGVLLLVLYGAD